MRSADLVWLTVSVRLEERIPLLFDPMDRVVTTVVAPNGPPWQSS